MLYHYSSSAGILGILESQSIWASTTDGLNDLKEIDHAADVLNHCFSNWLRASGRTDEERIKAISRKLLDHRGRFTGICVCSFSEDGDLLSQWRAYGADGRGISMGLNSILLQRDANAAGLLLGRCVYDYDSQYKVCSEFLQQLLNVFSVNWDECAIEDGMAEEVAVFLQTTGVFLKHPAFKDEAEWRLVSGKNHLYSPKWKFRAVNSGLTAYMVTDLPSIFCKETEERPLAPHFQFNLGPKARATPTNQILQTLTYRILGKGYGIHSSNVPYIE